jgi:hypothetical protein
VPSADTAPVSGTELRRVAASQLPDPSRGSALVAAKSTAQWDPGNLTAALAPPTTHGDDEAQLEQGADSSFLLNEAARR